MPPTLSIVLGILLIVVAVIDLIWSTLLVGGGGGVSRRMANRLWRIALWGHRRVGSHRLLEASAPIIVVSIVIVWITLLWVGWLLIFISAPNAVVDATSQEPTGFVDRIYFVGYILFTLGNGDLSGGSALWRVLSAVASINGLFTVTLAITYLLPVINAATAKRQLALLIDALGNISAEIVVNGWNGQNFSCLENQLREIAPRLLLHSENHLAYPVLHYFHSSDEHAALAPKLLALDDAVILLSNCVSEAQRPDGSTLRATTHAVDVFLNRIQHRYIACATEVPALPVFDAIRRAGIELVDEAACERAFAEHTKRRQWLLGFVLEDGWHNLSDK